MFSGYVQITGRFLRNRPGYFKEEELCQRREIRNVVVKNVVAKNVVVILAVILVAVIML